MDWDAVDAVLFDLDGVITPTAEVHMRAWEVMFSCFLEDNPGLHAAYTDDDYYAYVDGKPRYEGVQSFLESRGISLPPGEATDPTAAQTVRGLGNRKNVLFREILREEGIDAYPGALRLLDHLEERGIAVAVVSSSKNAPLVLASAGLTDRFPVVVDGKVAAEHQIPGKPRPDMFWYAAEQLGVAPERCIVIEDAVSGVEAGAAGGFAQVIGVDRGAGAEVLREAGADVVVSDPGELLP